MSTPNTRTNRACASRCVFFLSPVGVHTSGPVCMSRWHVWRLCVIAERARHIHTNPHACLPPLPRTMWMKRRAYVRFRSVGRAVCGWVAVGGCFVESSTRIGSVSARRSNTAPLWSSGRWLSVQFIVGPETRRSLSAKIKHQPLPIVGRWSTVFKSVAQPLVRVRFTYMFCIIRWSASNDETPFVRPRVAEITKCLELSPWAIYYANRIAAAVVVFASAWTCVCLSVCLPVPVMSVWYVFFFRK